MKKYSPRTKEKCTHIRTRRAGDESWDLREETERPSGRIQSCLLESGNECEEYNDFLKELEEEAKNEKEKNH